MHGILIPKAIIHLKLFHRDGAFCHVAYTFVLVSFGRVYSCNSIDFLWVS